VLHFLSDGSVKLMFSHEKTLCFAPLLLVARALAPPPLSDRWLAERVVGAEGRYLQGCVLGMLRQLHEDGVHSQDDALRMLGASFRFKFRRLPPWLSDQDVARFLLKSVAHLSLFLPLD